MRRAFFFEGYRRCLAATEILMVLKIGSYIRHKKVLT